MVCVGVGAELGKVVVVGVIGVMVGSADVCDPHPVTSKVMVSIARNGENLVGVNICTAVSEFILVLMRNALTCPTARVTGAGTGVDSAWEQKKLEARKMLENAAESPASSARFVGRCSLVSLCLLS